MIRVKEIDRGREGYPLVQLSVYFTYFFTLPHCLCTLSNSGLPLMLKLFVILFPQKVVFSHKPTYAYPFYFQKLNLLPSKPKFFTYPLTLINLVELITTQLGFLTLLITDCYNKYLYQSFSSINVHTGTWPLFKRKEKL